MALASRSSTFCTITSRSRIPRKSPPSSLVCYVRRTKTFGTLNHPPHHPRRIHHPPNTPIRPYTSHAPQTTTPFLSRYADTNAQYLIYLSSSLLIFYWLQSSSTTPPFRIYNPLPLLLQLSSNTSATAHSKKKTNSNEAPSQLWIESWPTLRSVFAAAGLRIEEATRQRRQATVEYVERNYILTPRNVDEGRYYTLLTHAFTHGNIWHLGIDSYLLWELKGLYMTSSWAIALWLGCSAAGAGAWLYNRPASASSTSKGKSGIAVGGAALVAGLHGAALARAPLGLMGLWPVPHLQLPSMVVLPFSLWCYNRFLGETGDGEALTGGQEQYLVPGFSDLQVGGFVWGALVSALMLRRRVLR